MVCPSALTLLPCSRSLDFEGRVREASVKNMQIIDRHGKCCLQFGRVSRVQTHTSLQTHVFVCDYAAPLNALRAFAFCLARFR